MSRIGSPRRRAGAAASPSAPSITAYKVQEKYEVGVRLLQCGHVRAAIQQFQEASFFDAEDARPTVALAECYVFLCDLRSAIRCYRRALWSLRKKPDRRPQKCVMQDLRASVVLSAEAITSLLSSLTPRSTALDAAAVVELPSPAAAEATSTSDAAPVLDVSPSLEPPLAPAAAPEATPDVLASAPAPSPPALEAALATPPQPPLPSPRHSLEEDDASVSSEVAAAAAAPEPFTLPPPPARPNTAQFTPPPAFLSQEALHAMLEGQQLPTRENTDAALDAADEPAAEARWTGVPARPSVTPSPTASPSWSVAASTDVAKSSVVVSSSLPSGAPHALTVSEVRCRLAGVLDALGLALFQVGSVEQALRCTTEALELIAAEEASGGGSGGGAASLTSQGMPAAAQLFARAPNPFLSEPVIALHRAVFLMALQREEEAEVLLGSHYNLFSSCRAQSAPLLIQLYCNRQAFRKARLLLEYQEEGFQAAALRAERTAAAAAAAISSTASAEASEAGDAQIGDRSYSDLPTAGEGEAQVADGAGAEREEGLTQRPDTTAALPASSTPASLTVAKFIFTELYARYRSAALASDDEDSVTRCLDVYPNDVDLLFRRAQLRIAAGDLKRSIKDLFTCVQDTNGEHKAAIEAMTTVLFTLGSSLDGESEVQNAVTYYSESLKWRPDNLLVLLARGDCYTKMESFEEALGDYNAILNYAPGHREAQSRIAALHDLWGRRFYALDSVTEAEVEFTNAIKADGTNPDFFYHRALCRLRLNQGQYALRDVLSCKELRPSAPHLRAFIARYMEPTQQVADEEAEERESRREGGGRSKGGKGASHRDTAFSSSDGSSRHASPSSSAAAAKWYGARTPPPPPPPPPPAEMEGRRRHRAASRKKGTGISDYAASEVSSSCASSSSVVSLPPIPSLRSRARAANSEGWVQGCQTTLHNRPREEALSQTK